MLFALYHPQEAEGYQPQRTAVGCENRSDNRAAAPESKTDFGAFFISPEISAFRYTIERKRRFQGAWHSVTATLFPNFLFFDCDKDAAEELKKENLPIVSIPEELTALLTDLSDEQHYIPMSKGVIKDGVAHVTEGPLIGQDNRIVRIDRHKRLAWLKVSENWTRNFAKDSTSVLVAGLEITERLS